MELNTDCDTLPIPEDLPVEEFDFSRYQTGNVQLSFTPDEAADLLFGDNDGKAEWKERQKLKTALSANPKLNKTWKSPYCFFANNTSCASSYEQFHFDFSNFTVCLEVTDISGYITHMAWPDGANFHSIYEFLISETPPTNLETSMSRSDPPRRREFVLNAP